MSPDTLKQRVAEVAFTSLAPILQSNLVLGIGTGSTVNCFIDCLARASRKLAGAVSSSRQTTEILKSHDIEVLDANDVMEVSVYVDGADEVAPDFALIKGGGGALTQEKIVASIARKFVCIVDESKLVDRLGSFPVPIEVLPLASRAVAAKISKFGGLPKVREGQTDNGNRIIDVSGLEIVDAEYWERALNNIPGVITAGIFALQRPQEVFVARADGSVEHKKCPPNSDE